MSSDATVALEYPSSGETQDRLGSVLVQKSYHVDDDVQLSGEVLDWYRGEDAGDPKRSELNELVEKFNMSQRPSRGKCGKSNQKVVVHAHLDRTGSIVFSETSAVIKSLIYKDATELRL